MFAIGYYLVSEQNDFDNGACTPSSHMRARMDMVSRTFTYVNVHRYICCDVNWIVTSCTLLRERDDKESKSKSYEKFVYPQYGYPYHPPHH
jgi:hypothetical protein